MKHTKEVSQWWNKTTIQVNCSKTPFRRIETIETTQKPKDRLNKEIIEGIVKDFSNLKEKT